jgi:hypothetical protein
LRIKSQITLKPAKMVKFPNKPKPFISIKEKREASYDHSTHSLLSIKIIPDSLISLRAELLNHPDILREVSKPEWNTFELTIGRIAQMLNIVLDGDYIPDGLFTMLTTALKNRHKSAEFAPQLLAPGHGLKEVVIKETENEITLAKVAEDRQYGSHDNVGTGPYTICDNCITSFECCDTRSCRLGKPAIQLEGTVEALRRSVK